MISIVNEITDFEKSGRKLKNTIKHIERKNLTAS